MLKYEKYVLSDVRLLRKFINIPLHASLVFYLWVLSISKNGKSSWVWIATLWQFNRTHSISRPSPTPLLFPSFSLGKSLCPRKRRINANTRLTNAQTQLSSAYIHIPNPAGFLPPSFSKPIYLFQNIRMKFFLLVLGGAFSCIHDS